MHIVTADQVEALRQQLPTDGGLRIARLNIDIDPFDFARTGAVLVDRAVALSTPNGDRRVGLGTAWFTSSAGESRFADVSASVRELADHDVTLFVGYSFLDEVDATGPWGSYRAAEAFLPRIGIERIGDMSALTVAIPDGEHPSETLDLLASMRTPEWQAVDEPGDHTIESHPPVTEWANVVEKAVQAINAESLDKVVLARSVEVENTEPVAILRVFRQLAARYPQCFNFAWKSSDSVFMGASPELLVSRDGSNFRSNPLAGSAPRGEGEDEDQAIGQQLVASPKDQEEHRLVVDDMRDRLHGLVHELAVPATPSLKKMATVQHLSTVIEGRTDSDTDVMKLVETLHPTPAVGGVPRADAVDYIAGHEGFDRGWYTGGIGWMTPEGDGEVAIALRCGLINASTSTLFAGAGIVGDSVPADEVRETRLKLRPLLDIVAAT